MLNNYVKVFLRGLIRQKGYSFINIAGLAAGMACCILFLLWISDEVSYDRFHENADNLYRTFVNHEGMRGSTGPWALAPVLKEDYPEIINSSRCRIRDLAVKYDEANYYEAVAMVDKEFFEMFTFPFVLGNPATAFDSRLSAVITEQAARKYFGADNPVGKTLTVDNTYDLVVTGVIGDIPSNSHLQFDLLAPVQLVGEERLGSWWYECFTYIQLDKNAVPDEVSSKISGVIMKYDKRTNAQITLDIQPITRIHLYALQGADPVIYVYIFSIIAVLILLIACINFINLATARAGGRAKEIGMRKVVGAAKSDIVKQYFGESICASVTALVIAVILVWLFLPAFNTMAGKHLTLNTAGNISTAAGLLGIAIITGMISGSYPALLLSSFRPSEVIKASKQQRAGGLNIRRILVIGQFTAAIVLLIGTLVVYRQLDYIRNKELGLNKEHVAVVTMNNELQAGYQSLKDELKMNPNITSVSAATSMPTDIHSVNPAYWEGKGPEDYTRFNFVGVDYDYFETFGMELVQGRSFSEEYPTDNQNYIINEVGLKLTGLREPLGKMFSMWDNEGKIIGIVRNFHSKSLHNELSPILFTLRPDWNKRYMFVKMKPGSISGTIEFIKNKAAEFAPGYPFDFTFLDEAFDRQYRIDRRVGSVFKYFTILAVFISCLGLFGMASFMAQQRIKEIGIRKTLGASTAGIVLLVSREFIGLIFISILIAWPAAYFAVQRLLENYAFRTDINVWIFAAAAALALIIAMLTVGYQTIRAARSNPVDSLRYE